MVQSNFASSAAEITRFMDSVAVRFHALHLMMKDDFPHELRHHAHEKRCAEVDFIPTLTVLFQSVFYRRLRAIRRKYVRWGANCGKLCGKENCKIVSVCRAKCLEQLRLCRLNVHIFRRCGNMFPSKNYRLASEEEWRSTRKLKVFSQHFHTKWQPQVVH